MKTNFHYSDGKNKENIPQGFYRSLIVIIIQIHNHLLDKNRSGSGWWPSVESKLDWMELKKWWGKRKNNYLQLWNTHSLPIKDYNDCVS